MKPKPFSELNHFTVPCVAMIASPISVPVARVSRQPPGQLLFDFRWRELGNDETGLTWGEPNPRDTARKAGAAKREGVPVPSRSRRDFATEADNNNLSDGAHLSRSGELARVSLRLPAAPVTAIVVFGRGP